MDALETTLDANEDTYEGLTHNGTTQNEHPDYVNADNTVIKKYIFLNE